MNTTDGVAILTNGVAGVMSSTSIPAGGTQFPPVVWKAEILGAEGFDEALLLIRTSFAVEYAVTDQDVEPLEADWITLDPSGVVQEIIRVPQFDTSFTRFVWARSSAGVVSASYSVTATIASDPPVAVTYAVATNPSHPNVDSILVTMLAGQTWSHYWIGEGDPPVDSGDPSVVAGTVAEGSWIQGSYTLPDPSIARVISSLTVAAYVGGVLDENTKQTNAVTVDRTRWFLQTVQPDCSENGGVGVIGAWCYKQLAGTPYGANSARTLDVSTSGSTAVSGTDYDPAGDYSSGKIHFAAGESYAELQITGKHNASLNDKYALFTISNPSDGGDIDATKATKTISILNEDVVTGAAGFQNAAVTINEADGTLTLNIIGSGPASGNVTAPTNAYFGGGTQAWSLGVGATATTVDFGITHTGVDNGGGVSAFTISGNTSGIQTCNVTVIDAEAGFTDIDSVGDVRPPAGKFGVLYRGDQTKPNNYVARYYGPQDSSGLKVTGEFHVWSSLGFLPLTDEGKQFVESNDTWELIPDASGPGSTRHLQGDAWASAYDGFEFQVDPTARVEVTFGVGGTVPSPDDNLYLGAGLVPVAQGAMPYVLQEGVSLSVPFTFSLEGPIPSQLVNGMTPTEWAVRAKMHAGPDADFVSCNPRQHKEFNDDDAQRARVRYKYFTQVIICADPGSVIELEIENLLHDIDGDLVLKRGGTLSGLFAIPAIYGFQPTMTGARTARLVIDTGAIPNFRYDGGYQDNCVLTLTYPSTGPGQGGIEERYGDSSTVDMYDGVTKGNLNGQITGIPSSNYVKLAIMHPLQIVILKRYPVPDPATDPTAFAIPANNQAAWLQPATQQFIAGQAPGTDEDGLQQYEILPSIRNAGYTKFVFPPDYVEGQGIILLENNTSWYWQQGGFNHMGLRPRNNPAVGIYRQGPGALSHLEKKQISEAYKSLGWDDPLPAQDATGFGPHLIGDLRPNHTGSYTTMQNCQTRNMVVLKPWDGAYVSRGGDQASGLIINNEDNQGDGFTIDAGALLESSFESCKDDGCKLYGTAIARDILSMHKNIGAPFQLSWGLSGNQSPRLEGGVIGLHPRAQDGSHNCADICLTRLDTNDNGCNLQFWLGPVTNEDPYPTHMFQFHSVQAGTSTRNVTVDTYDTRNYKPYCLPLIDFDYITSFTWNCRNAWEAGNYGTTHALVTKPNDFKAWTTWSVGAFTAAYSATAQGIGVRKGTHGANALTVNFYLQGKQMHTGGGTTVELKQPAIPAGVSFPTSIDGKTGRRTDTGATFTVSGTTGTQFTSNVSLPEGTPWEILLSSWTCNASNQWVQTA